MKKYIATFILGFSIMLVCHAQNTTDSVSVKHHEFYAGVGFLSDVQIISGIIDFVTNVYTDVYTFGLAGGTSRKFLFFTPSIGYRYWFNKKVGIGVNFSFDKCTVTETYVKEVNTFLWILPTFEYEYNIYDLYYYTTAVNFNWNYVNRPIFQLYGNVGMGTTIVQSSDGINKLYFNMHVSPFGVRVGKMVAGFTEVGFGYKGIINMGLSVKF